MENKDQMKIIENGGNAQMRLFTLFISYRSGIHYCGVYPSLEHLHDVIGELAVENDLGKIPNIDEIKSGIEDRDSFWYEFPDSTWLDVQETSGGLVTAILDEYFEKFYSDLAARIDAKVASLSKENQTKEGDSVDNLIKNENSVVCKSCGHDLTQAQILFGKSAIEFHRSLHTRSAPTIICAAIWYDDKITTHKHQPKNIISGYVVAGRRHHNCIAIHSILGALHPPMCAIQGFLTSDDRFVCREEAGEIAFKARQIPTPTDCLMSEDLY